MCDTTPRYQPDASCADASPCAPPLPAKAQPEFVFLNSWAKCQSRPKLLLCSLPLSRDIRLPTPPTPHWHMPTDVPAGAAAATPGTPSRVAGVGPVIYQSLDFWGGTCVCVGGEGGRPSPLTAPRGNVTRRIAAGHAGVCCPTRVCPAQRMNLLRRRRSKDCQLCFPFLSAGPASATLSVESTPNSPRRQIADAVRGLPCSCFPLLGSASDLFSLSQGKLDS